MTEKVGLKMESRRHLLAFKSFFFIFGLVKAISNFYSRTASGNVRIIEVGIVLNVGIASGITSMSLETEVTSTGRKSLSFSRILALVFQVSMKEPHSRGERQTSEIGPMRTRTWEYI
jgi:hypothetical protein